MWSARDKDGYLNIFETHPKRRSFFGSGYKKDMWRNNTHYIHLNNKRFKYLKWENEPRVVDIYDVQKMTEWFHKNIKETSDGLTTSFTSIKEFKQSLLEYIS